MQSVRFLNGGRAGFRYYQAGQVAGVPDIVATRLIAAGEAEIASPAIPVDEKPARRAKPAVARRVRKPARGHRQKG